jgi:hypothetical protein
MTQQEIKKLQARIDRLYARLRETLTNNEMQYVYELIECERLLEIESNK